MKLPRFFDHFAKLFFLLLFACSNTSLKSKKDDMNDLSSPQRFKASGKRPVILLADLKSDTYSLIAKTLGSLPETPDCSDKLFGPHITQKYDTELKMPIFVFHIHLKKDDDRCKSFDRQRVEIKTMGNNPTSDYLKAFQGDSASYRWIFKIPKGFKSSQNFTHIHQIKAFDGDDKLPLVTLTLKKETQNGSSTLQVLHIDSSGKTINLAPQTFSDRYEGIWLEAEEKIKFGSNGFFSFKLSKLKEREEIFFISKTNLDLWRTNTTIIRPKWGVYRSLKNLDQLRDEEFFFGGFCLAKENDECDSLFFKKNTSTNYLVN